MDRAHAGGKGNGIFSTLQLSHGLLKGTDGGAAVSWVDKAGPLAAKDPIQVRHVVVQVAHRIMDGRAHRREIRSGPALACVDRLGEDTLAFQHHSDPFLNLAMVARAGASTKPPRDIVLGARLARPGKDLFARSDLHQFAVQQKGGQVGHARGLLHAVGHQDDGIFRL